jgi:hypothetical protein
VISLYNAQKLVEGKFIQERKISEEIFFVYTPPTIINNFNTKDESPSKPNTLTHCNGFAQAAPL